MILGHPNAESYCAALAQAYIDGAGGEGDQVTYLKLYELAFDPILRFSKALQQPLEADLLTAQEKMRQADHWVLVYPTWWGHVPALMKGFFDRTLVQGFGFAYQDNQLLWEKLLKGKTAHIITTMSTPPWFYRLGYGDCGIQTLKKTTLGFCGIKTTQVTRIGQLRKFDEKQRTRWIEIIRQFGRQHKNKFLLQTKAVSPIVSET